MKKHKKLSENGMVLFREAFFVLSQGDALWPYAKRNKVVASP